MAENEHTWCHQCESLESERGCSRADCQRFHAELRRVEFESGPKQVRSSSELLYRGRP